MKKNFVKKLALGLALVMAVTSVPASSEAAATPGFKSSAVKVRVGQTKKYSTENSKKYSVKFKIGNKKVATIKYTAGSKSVKVTGVAEGKTTLRADFKSYKTKKVTTAKVPVTVLAAKAETPVVAEAELTAIKQTASNAFEATFTTDAREKVTAASFTKVESADETYTLAVKSVEWSADGKTAKVTTYGNLVDKTVFNVTCNGKTASFTASVGAVVSAVIDTVQAEANVKTAVKFRLFDANGIDVTSAVALDKYVALSVDGDYYDVDFTKASKANVTLANVGGEVEITLVYDPVTATGEVITATGKIVCVDTKASVGKTTYFTLSDGYAAPGTTAPKIYLNSFKEDTTMYVGDGTDTFYFAALDNSGEAIEYDYFEVESSNEDVITVGNYGHGANLKYAEIDVNPENVGTAKVVITAYKNDVKTVYAKTVSVKAERKLTSVVLSKNTLTISNSAKNNNDFVAVVLLDQYGNNMSATNSTATWTAAQVNGGTDLNITQPAGNTSKKVAFVDAPATTAAGNYIVAVEATDGYDTVVKKFSVNVREANPSITTSYKIELSATSMDLNPEERAWTATNLDGKVEARVAEYRGTVFTGYVSGGSLTSITVKNGGKYFKSLALTDTTTSTGITTVASGTALSMSSTVGLAGMSDALVLDPMNGNDYRTGNAFGTAMNSVAANGTYTVVAKLNNSAGVAVTATGNFTIKNTMELPSVKVESTTGEGTTLLDVVEDCITVDNDILDAADACVVGVYDANFTNISGTTVVSGQRYVNVKYVEIQDTFNGSTYSYYLPLSRTFKAE